MPEEFYSHEDILQQARLLLGKVLMTRVKGRVTSGVIVETEAYKAPEDKASHAHGNKRTGRTEVMFGNGGHAYVYLCYGIHEMFNVVVGPTEKAHAILIRAVEPLDGMEIIQDRRRLRRSGYNLGAGPGNLTRSLAIDRSMNGLNLMEREHVWIEDREVDPPAEKIVATPRVGIDYAEEWIEKPWRFILRDSPWVS